MELTFDPHSWLPPARSSRRSDGPAIARPDWQALAARLCAAHAFQRHALREQRAAALRRSGIDRAAQVGSFDAGSARLMARFAQAAAGASATLQNDELSLASDEGKMLADVNPTSSGDRKDATGIFSVVAGPLPSGNRGLK